MQQDLLSLHDQSMQTDLAQFQIDEITLKLHDLQQQNASQVTYVDRSAETSLHEPAKASIGIRTDSITMLTKETQINILPITEDKSTETENVSFANRSMETEVLSVNNRSMETANASLWRGECSRSVQTAFTEDEAQDTLSPTEEAEGLESAKNKRRRFSNQKNVYSFEDIPYNEISIQCSIHANDTCDTGVQTLLSGGAFDDFNGLDTAGEKGRMSRSESILTLYQDSIDVDGKPTENKQKQVSEELKNK